MKKIKKKKNVKSNNKSNERKRKKKNRLEKEKRRKKRKQLEKKKIQPKETKKKKQEINQKEKLSLKEKTKKIWETKKTYLLIFVIGILLFGYGIFHVIIWFVDNHNTKIQQKNLPIHVQEVSATDTEEAINPPSEDEEEQKDNDYFNYMKLPFLSVDFDELTKKNSDTVAFIKVNGTNINYPVVQTDNNDYYLNHSYNKKKNSAGWVFLDYRNNINELQDNTILYAHGRQDSTMFGSLKNTLKESWFKDSDNHVIYTSTPTYNMVWQIFSIYKIPTETYYLTSSFGSEESHQNFINEITKRSKFNFNATIDTNDKILTLSTCYSKTEKAVIHAKLIKRTER